MCVETDISTPHAEPRYFRLSNVGGLNIKKETLMKTETP
jgi:hypothetical protein